LREATHSIVVLVFFLRQVFWLSPACFTFPALWPVALYKQAFHFRGMTAAGTAADSHRIPLRQVAYSHLTALFSAAKIRKKGKTGKRKEEKYIGACTFFLISFFNLFFFTFH